MFNPNLCYNQPIVALIVTPFISEYLYIPVCYTNRRSIKKKIRVVVNGLVGIGLYEATLKMSKVISCSHYIKQAVAANLLNSAAF